MTGKCRAVTLPLVLILGIAAVVGMLLADSGAKRPDCPGKIVCPLTGQLVCKDRCPVRDVDRPDCPGRIVCPRTGKPVCRDRCPLEANGPAPVTSSRQAPPCCTKTD